MKQYVCRNCGKTYTYCRGCLLSPVLYKAMGFCSEKCHNEFENKQREEVIRKDVEVVIEHEDIPTSEEETVECPHFFTEKENDINDEIENNGEIIRTE